MRTTRARVKRFSYGDQWSDTTFDPQSGRMRTDAELYLADGYRTITNNVMRPIIKTLVGRYRSEVLSSEDAPESRQLQHVADVNQLDELDSRAFEEFLISGVVVQRVESLGGGMVDVNTVGLDRFFVNAMRDVRGNDCELIGQLHDLSLADLLQRVARGSRRRAVAIKRLYLDNADSAPSLLSVGEDIASATEFWNSHEPGKCRAIEVWTLESHENTGSRWGVKMQWHCRWYAPSGELLVEYDSPWQHRSHPFVFKFFPLTDGEVHPFMEDVIDQQLMINRMVTVLDKIMRCSAKGVLLYPAEALPAGFTWNDLTRLWSHTGSIVPYVAGESGEAPRQITSNGTDMGAFEMIRLQLQMLERIGGVTGALQGLPGSGTTGAALYQAQSTNADMALTDLFDTFTSFRRARNRRLRSLVGEQTTRL